MSANDLPGLDSQPAGAQSGEWQPVDLLLSQGTTEELSAMRRSVASNPMQAMELADTVALLEQFRDLRTDASPEFAGKLQDVVLHADRFCRSHYQKRPPMWVMPLISCMAAAATFWLLWWLDAAQLWQHDASKSQIADFGLRANLQDAQNSYGSSDPAAGGQADSSLAAAIADLSVRPEPPISPESPISPEQASWEQAITEIMSRLDQETSAHLREAFRAGIVNDSDRLKQWLDPRNAMVMLRLEHELRASADARIAALHKGGALAEVDDRVQELADGIAADLLQQLQGEAQLGDVSWSVRALIAAGSAAPRALALRSGGDWLAQQVPSLQGEKLVVALTGLMELATISGQHFEAVALHGRRLVDDILQPSDENWRRRLPELLSGRAAPGVLGDAGRMLARLPAFGVDPARCSLVRKLLLGHLRDRRLAAQDQPDVLAAILYGCNDLLDEATSEGDRVGWQLLRWKPVRLAPDFMTVQQIAWSRTPGSRGYTRLQRELRQLAILPVPPALANRAAFCMCLATNYAAYAGSMQSEDE